MRRSVPHLLLLRVMILPLCTVAAVAQAVEWDSAFYHRNLFFGGIDCADRMNCGAVGHDGNRVTILVVTTDGGATWTRRVIEDHAVTKSLPPRPYDVANPSPGVFVVAADSGVVWTTTDGGASFRRSKTPIDGVVSEVEMWDERRGVVASKVGAMYETTDNWHSFRRVEVDDSIAHYDVTELRALAADSLLVLAFDPRTDRVYFMLANVQGDPWVRRQAPRPARSLSVPDSRLVAVAGYLVTNPDNGASNTVVWFSADLGMTWQQMLDTTHWSGVGALEISMADTRFGITYGNFGQVWATTDGGSTWSSDSVVGLRGPGRAFYDVQAFPDRSALAATAAEYIVAREPMISSADEVEREPQHAVEDMRFEPRTGLLTLGRRVDDDANPVLYSTLGERADVTARRSSACGANSSCWEVDMGGLAQGFYLVSIPGIAHSLWIVVTD